MSRRETVIAAAITALNTGTPGGVPAAERKRKRQYEASVTDAITVFWTREEVEPATNRHGPAVTRALVLVVEARTRSDTPDADLDPLLSWITEALGGAGKLGGVALDIQEQRTDVEYDEAEDGFALASVEFQVNYLTRRDDLTQL